jgi:hypothetical protein
MDHDDPGSERAVGLEVGGDRARVDDDDVRACRRQPHGRRGHRVGEEVVMGEHEAAPRDRGARRPECQGGDDRAHAPGDEKLGLEVGHQSS